MKAQTKTFALRLLQLKTNDNFTMNTTKPKSKLTTGLLCFFFGAIGAHRFYTGYAWLGVLYSLTFGFLLIGVIVDLFFIGFGQYEDFQTPTHL